ncbi:hypothetical protein [Halalkalibaculum sp. DA384]|uniref:hypothetical protein n=1 Tax=Halalkalibaculum sp. DA384 TaxID=3373606 RepID=UPI003753F2D9
MKSIPVWRWPILLLILLISADLMFIGLEIIHTVGYASDNKFSLGTERGYSEVYQYVKFFWVAFLLGWLTIKMYQPIYGIGSLLFLYLLLDDSLEIHETAGGDIADWVGLAPALGLRGKDYGELAVYALVGTLFLALGWLAYRASNALARQISWYVLGGVIVLAIFGAGADMLHALLMNRFPWSDTPMLILEDGGELIALSGITWIVFSFANQELNTDLSYDKL